MRAGRVACCLLAASATVGGAGCGTTRMTDTQRAACEMMLVSQAIDSAVAKLDFSALEGKPVFLDTQYLDGTVDKGYLISSLRQQLLASGALLQEERQRALYVVEPRSGAIGTDKHSLLVGTPQMSLPAVLPGVPTAVPEIALIKKTDQKGVAKLAVFAYNRVTGRALWQSGMVDADSTLKDTWVFGAGPISRGTIRKRTELAGEELPKIPVPFAAKEHGNDPPLSARAADPTHQYVWTNANAPPPVQPVPFPLLGVTGAAAAVDRELIHFAPTAPAAPLAPIVPVSRPAPLPGTVQAPPFPLPTLRGG